MSLTFSPTTGRLIKVGSDEFSKLVRDPVWGKHFTVPDDSSNTKVSPMVPKPQTPTLLPPLRSLEPSSNTNRYTNRYNSYREIKPLRSLDMNYMEVPEVPGVGGNNNSNNLPPIPKSPRLNNSLNNYRLPPIPKSPRALNNSNNRLPPVPLSPRLNNSNSLNNRLPKNIRKQRLPTKPVDLPSVSVPVYKVWDQIKPEHEEHLNAILSLPLYDIPTLEEVKSKTTQPFLRERLQRMIDSQKESEGRGIKTRGWSARAPQRGRPRNQLMNECGSACFLKPDTKGFPICPKCQLGDGKCVCAIDCGGVQAAKVRARQWGYDSIADLADKVLQTKCVGLSSFTPSK